MDTVAGVETGRTEEQTDGRLRRCRTLCPQDRSVATAAIAGTAIVIATATATATATVPAAAAAAGVAAAG